MKDLALAVVLLVGCSTAVEVRSTPAPGVYLSELRSFGFMAPAHPDAPGAQLARLPAGQQIRDTITRDLIKKGYLPVAKGATPEFLVAFYVHTQQKTEVQDWGYSAPSWWWGAGPDVTVYQYSEGTLFVDFID